MKKTLLVVTAICLLALSVSAQAMMGSGGSTGMMPGAGTGTTGGTGATSVTSSSIGMMGSYLQMPMAHQMFTYGPTVSPVVGTDISTSMPIGVGPVAMGGNMITIHTAIGQFTNPMDMYLTVYAPAVDPFNVYMYHPDGTIRPVSEGVEPWMTGVTSVDQTPISNMPTSGLAKGTYTVGLTATQTGSNMSNYYMWTTNFVIQ